MKVIISLIVLFLIVVLWNNVPYSYSCFDYPLTGCGDYEFWWNLPTDWEEYKGVRWGVYFGGNLIYTFIFLLIYGKIVKLYDEIVKP